MIFIETRAFSRRRAEHLDEDDFRSLQAALLADPAAGALVRGSGGLRKIRWSRAGKGKRGGVRVIYFHVLTRSVILLLLLYPKNEQDDLTPEQKRILRELVQTEIANPAGGK
jgi:mRNA-degrading endonuclease RelE of RelBE toxin-antitoxin system